MTTARARLAIAFSFVLLASGLSAKAANYAFNVASGDWQTGTNWNPNGVPGSPDSATVNGGRTVTVNSGTGTVATSGDTLNNLHVGGNQDGSVAGNGTLTQTGGTVHTDWLRIGRGNGNTGTFNLSGGTMNVLANGGAFVGGENDNANGFMNMTDGTFNVGTRFRVGHIAGASSLTSNGTFTQSGGTVNSSTSMIVGHREGGSGTARGTYSMNGGVLNTTTLNAGNGSQGFGTVNQTGGTINVSADGWRHGQNGGTAVLNLSGGTLNHPNGNPVIGDGANGNATVNHSGTHTTVARSMWVGHNGARGTYNMSGGTLSVTSGDGINVGRGGSAATGVFSKTGGVVTSANNLNVGFNTGTGTFSQSGGSTSITGELNVGRDTGDGTLVHTGGTLNTGNSWVGTGNSSSRGTLDLSGGTLNLSQIRLGTNAAGGGGGTMLVHGANLTSSYFEAGWNAPSRTQMTSGTWNNNGNMTLGRSGGSATVEVTGGKLVTGTIEVAHDTNSTGQLTVAGTGQINTPNLQMSAGNPGLSTLSRFNLEGGTFRADTITVANTANEFNWGSGVLALNITSGTLGTGDLSLGTSNSPTVTYGRQLTFQQGGYTGTGANETIATGSGINASGLDVVGGASNLNLGGLYLSAGVRYNKAVFNDGMSLNASAAGDILSMDTELANDTVYLLRPFGFFTEDYGSLPLIQFNGGGSMTGTFDTFIGLMDDGKGFSMSTFAVTTATANTLAVNTWYLEQTASGVTFHYKVAGSVPEPDTFALLALSVVGLRTARTLRERRRRVVESASSA